MGTPKSDTDAVLNLRAGEMVEVRSRSEILATLDSNGRRDGLPFMPEMLKYCGKQFRVYKRADKTCDTITRPRALRMEHAVHLHNVRCDGLAHGGCQAGCLMFWKEAWLRRIEPRTRQPFEIADTPASPDKTDVCTEETLARATRRQSDTASLGEEIFSCQSTELVNATSLLAWWDVRQYVRDITSGNVGLALFTRGMLISLFNLAIRTVRRCVIALGHRVGHRSSPGGSSPNLESSPHPASTTSAIDHMTPIEGVVAYMKSTVDTLLVEYPHVQGALNRTPSTVLNLRPGESVRVKSKDEIAGTLDVNNRNRGLLFDVEMVPYCGGTYRVLRRVERILDEKTGRMRRLSNNCIILDGVVCGGCVSRHRLFCPRSIYSYWHEIWLERAE